MSQAWWHRPLRIYQPNLRLIDGDQDARSIIRQAEDLSANAIVVNAGGAFAFYSTDLDCQERVPSLSGDLFGEIVSEGHARDIRVIARIEVSVKPRSVYDIHPEWCYVDAEGSPLDARGHYSTCINGPGFRDQLRAIIAELMDRFGPDGVFFNGYGYRESDAGGYRGPCQCVGCARAFHEATGMHLPSKQAWRDRSDPACNEYERFKTDSAGEFLREVNQFVRGLRPDALLYHGTSYTPPRDIPGYSPADALSALGDAADIVRCEYIQAPLEDPATWSYWTTEQGKIGLGAGRRTDIILDYPMSGRHRHACHSAGWTALVLARTLAGASIPHLHFIGTLDDQEDKQGVPALRKLMAFAGSHEAVYDSPEPASPVALFHSHRSAKADTDGRYLEAYRGWYRALARGHVPFDVLPSCGMS